MNKKIDDFILEFFRKNNLNDVKSREIFVNHMNQVIKRGKSNSYIDEEVEKAMKKEIGEDKMQCANIFSKTFVNEYNIPQMTSFEIFLISTHLSLF